SNHANWVSSGVYVNGERQVGELRPWTEILHRLCDRELELAVQELVAATVVAAGLPPSTYPMAIVTTLGVNHEACLLSAETQLERRALAVMLSAVSDDGLIVASADDFAVAEV